MSRTKKSIAIAIVLAFLIAPVSAWAKPAVAVDSFSVELTSFGGWLEMVWGHFLDLAQRPDKGPDKVQPANTDKDDDPPPATETGASGDPWG